MGWQTGRIRLIEHGTGTIRLIEHSPLSMSKTPLATTASMMRLML
jgi:hypothetical protein